MVPCVCHHVCITQRLPSSQLRHIVFPPAKGRCDMKLLIAVGREITFHEIQRFSFLLFAHGRWRASLGLSSGINSPARVTGALHASFAWL